jgi:hypothetical protein
MPYVRFSPSHREAREIGFETQLWPNTKDFVQGTVEDHVVTPAKNGEYIKASAGGVVAAGDIVFNGTDVLVAGITGERLERLRANEMRIGRDIGSISSHTVKAVGNLLTLHPIKAVGHTIGAAVGVTRVPGDVVMDGVDGVGGYRKQRPGGANYSLAS